MSGGQIFNTLVEFFEEDEWDFHWMEGLPVLSMGFAGRSGRWVCYAQARESQEQFVFYSVCPMNAPEDRRSAVAEFITRANYGMIIGNFELDYNDGEIRYKTSIDVEGDTLTTPLIKQCVYANIVVMDRYLPGIMRVIYGASEPLEEIGKIEGEPGDTKPKPSDSDLDYEDDPDTDDSPDFDEDDLDDDYPTNGTHNNN
ncbi:MAG: YbjN domain-containing protein [Armatimonadetes bacterium]|nr:YbjN domain-containing protein [Anaerolineae bacterium]